MESYFSVVSCPPKSPFYTFQGDEDENVEHYLDIRTVCLGTGAKERAT
uniref:Uncharacterized protein n=1 Tax=Anguilla anguilla TaxID=7936 RepID=A0A0E9TDB6_ANGAN